MGKRRCEEETNYIPVEQDQKDGDDSAVKSNKETLYPKKGRISPKQCYYVRCRQRPSLAYVDDTVPLLPAGHTISILGESGEFYEVSATRNNKDVKGFVLKSLCILEG